MKVEWALIHVAQKATAKWGGQGWKGLVKVNITLGLYPKPLWVQKNCFGGGNKRYVIPRLIKSNSENTKGSFQALVIWCPVYCAQPSLPGWRRVKHVALGHVGCVATQYPSAIFFFFFWNCKIYLGWSMSILFGGRGGWRGQMGRTWRARSASP